MLEWLRRSLKRSSGDHPEKVAPQGYSVSCDPQEVRLVRPDEKGGALLWTDIERVELIVSAGHQTEATLNWLISCDHGRIELEVPMGIEGEHDLVLTMQVRLHGFDRMAVVEAMSAPESARFTVWDADWPVARD